MEKHLRNAPTYAVIIALIIQVTRVSDFGTRIGAGWLAWVYAFFLALTIYALSYWVGRLKYDITAKEDEHAKFAQQKRMERLFARARVNAQIWLFLFLSIDGLLNLAETMSALPKDIAFWEFAGAGVYGVFPTLAAFGLGSLQAHIDKIPAGASKASLVSRLADKLLARLDTSDKQDLQGLHTSTLQGNKQDESLQVQATSKDDPLLVQGNKQDETLQVQVASKTDKQELTDDALLAYWQNNPQASDGQVARHFRRSTQAIQQRRKKLSERGAFFMQVPEPARETKA